MALHFDTDEFDRRIANVRSDLERKGLDGLLMFAQESMYYLTGYETFGFCFFQCLYLGLDGEPALLTRSADLRQAQHTSTITDIRIWTDEKGARPESQLKDMLASLGAAGKKLGIEFNSYGLTAYHGRALEAAFEGFCELVDASDLVSRRRAVKSDAELVYVRKAGELGDAAYDAAVAEITAGADEGDILAAMHNAVFRGGGEYPGNEFIIGSGADALLCRHKSGRRKLDANDQITLEWAGTYRRYHAALFRTIVTGEPAPEHFAMYEACAEALKAVEEALRPGSNAGAVFDAHARVMDAHGMNDHKLAACGYSLGAKFTPSWMDPPMFYRGHDWDLVPNMVMFAHMILMDSVSGKAMTLGRTYLVTDGAPEPLSRAPLDLVRK